MMTKEQTIFRRALTLVGKTVELGINSSGEHLVAEVQNAMFDSMLVGVKSKSRVIAFSDIAYLQELSSSKAA